MKKPDLPENEELRIADLHRLKILDTGADPVFDEITKLAATICQAKIALISIVDSHRQWFKSRHGLDASETPRDVSFCGHAILGDEVFEVPNSELNPDFCDNPLFLGEPHVRFYAGAPLITRNGFRVGTLCVIDDKAKQLDSIQKQTLAMLAKQVVNLMELKIAQNDSDFMKEQLERAQEISKVGSWQFDLLTREQFWSKEHYRIFEIEEPQSQRELYGKYRERIHPEDLARLDEHVARAISEGQDFVYDHRVFLDQGKKIKYVQGIGRVTKDHNGNPILLSGTCRDTTTAIEQEVKFRSILEAMSEGLVVQDENAKILQFNAAALQILNLSEDQLLGRSSFDPDWRAIKEDGTDFPGQEHPAIVALRTNQSIHGVMMGLRQANCGVRWIRINAILFPCTEGKRVLVTFADITQQVATKKEGESFFELSNNLLCIASTDGKFKRINPQFIKLLGFQESKILETPFLEMIHEADRVATEKAVQSMALGSCLVDFECRFLSSNGSYKRIRWSSSPDPKTGLIYSVGVDITAQKHKEFINETISKIRSLYIAHKEETNVFWDKTMQLLLNVSQSEYGFIGEVRHSAEGAPFLKTFSLTNIAWDQATRNFYEEKAKEGLEFHNLETIFGRVLKTGKLLIVNAPKESPFAGGLPKGHPPINSFLGIPLFYSGSFVGMIGLANHPVGFQQEQVDSLSDLFVAMGEIIHAFLLEKKFRESERLNAYYKIALDHRALVAFTDAKGKITYVNDMFCKISGYTRDEILGKDHRILNSKKMGKDFFKEMWQTISSGRQWNGEICNRAKDGREYWVDTTIVPFVGADGVIEKFIAIRRDITGEKQQKIELEAAYLKAEQATKAKSDFLSTMSHEIRTPLNGVIGMSNLLLESNLSQDQSEIANTISQSGKTLLMIINDILDFSKIEAGKVELEISEVNLRLYLTELLKPYQYTAQKNGISFHVNLGQDSNYVFVDEGRVGQIIANLVSNSIKFTKLGGIQIDLALDLEGDFTRMKFSVQDSGIGIPENAKARMFESFSQAEQSTTKRFGGTGLGLSISKRLVDVMQGKIWFESEFGKGTVFHVELKLKTGKSIEEGESSQLHLPEIAPATILSGRILVAEDNLTNQAVVARMLSKLGLKYHLVANGREALDALRDGPFDLILMDCQMPEMDGYETTGIIRSNKILPNDIPIIALTANAIKGSEAKCREAGMNEYLSKPIDRRALESVLGKYLSAMPSKVSSEKFREQPHVQDSVTQIPNGQKKKLIDETVFEQFEELQVPGQPDFLVEIIDSFLSSMPARMKSITQHFKERNIKNLAKEAHAMKSSLHTLGALTIAEVCQKLENLGETNNQEELDRLFPQLRDNFDQICNELNAIRLARLARSKGQVA